MSVMLLSMALKTKRSRTYSTLLSIIHRGATLFFAFFVAMCDLVHDVYAIFNLTYVLTASGNLFLKYE